MAMAARARLGALLQRGRDWASTVDMDEMLAYRTPKVVVMKDRFLGVLRLAVMIVILVYFVVDRLILYQAHFRFEEVAGVMETSFQVGASPAELPSYCAQPNVSNPGSLPCVDFNNVTRAWATLPYTTGSGGELFVVTRMKRIVGPNETRYFAVNPEASTVGVTFSLQALSLYTLTGDSKFSKTMYQLNTRLADGNREYPIERKGRFDVIRLADLLSAADVPDLALMNQDGKTLRSAGFVLIVTISCATNRAGSIDGCTYTAKHVLNSEAEEERKVWDDAQNSFVVESRRGIRIVLKLSGKMGQFEWAQLMLAWVSASVMLGITSVIIDLVMAWVMPLRAIYRELKWEETVDFSDYRAKKPHALKAVEEVRAATKRRTIGHQEDAEAVPQSPAAAGAGASGPENTTLAEEPAGIAGLWQLLMRRIGVEREPEGSNAPERAAV